MNKKYFHWLVTSHRALIIFTALTYIVFAYMPFILQSSQDIFTDCVRVCAALSVILAVAFPYMIFSYIHKKHGVDLYFSLPVSRRGQLVTGCLLSFFVSAGLFVIGTFFVWLSRCSSYVGFGQWLILQPWVIFSMAVIVLCAAFVNTVGNNLFDSVVLLFAYAALPMAVSVWAHNFSQTFIPGSPSLSVGWLSPAYMAVVNAAGLPGASFRSAYIIIMLIFAAVSVICLKKGFIDRKAERAEQISDGILGYPLIINAYALIVLAFIAQDSLQMGFINAQAPLLYAVLFVIYMVASFVWRRSFRIRIKSVVIFALGIALTVLIAQIGWNTRGFGLADYYTVDMDKDVDYDYMIEVSEEDLGKPSADSPVSVEFSLTVPADEKEKYSEITALLETYRKKQADDFYHDPQADAADRSYGNLGISNFEEEDGARAYNVYNYRTYEALSEKDLEKISRVTQVDVEDMDGNSYTLAEFLKNRK